MIRIGLYFLLSWLLVAVAIFASQNLQLVSINFLIWQSVNLPVGLVLVVCAGLGGLAVTILQILSWSSTVNANPDSTKSNASTNSSKKSNQPQAKTTKKPEPSDRFQAKKQTQVRTQPKSQPTSQTQYQPPKADDWEKRTNDWDNW